MNGAQKAIKALATLLAVMIMIGMISAVVGFGVVLDRVFWHKEATSSRDDGWQESVISEKVENVRELKINLKSASLTIERGAEFEVRADAEVVEFRREGDTVQIEEKDLNFFWQWHEFGGEVKVILPEEMEFSKVAIEMGAGVMDVRDLEAEELKMDLGAGKTELTRIIATREAKIESGAGLLIVREAKLANLNFDMGVGKVELEAKLEGTNKINAGLGKLELMLVGEQDDYRVSFDAGLGAMNQQGISLENPNGRNRVEIDGGVGAIDLGLKN